MKLGKNIKKLRELKNYTQQYLADELGISLSAYGKI
jgi:transcriptional regulator with XRE-family HTH domain